MFRRLLYITAFLLMVMAFPAMTMADSIADLPVKSIKGRDYYYYEVKPKDTEYSLSRRYGITREDILKFNPSQSDGLKAYATLFFPVDVFGPAATPEARPIEQPAVETPLASRPQESVSSPQQDPVVSQPSTPAPASDPIAREPLPSVFIPETVTPVEIAADDTTEYNLEPVFGQSVEIPLITLMLPLESAAKSPSRLGQLYTEFYRGFLMGVEEESHSGGKINIRVIDTSVSDNEFSRILDSEELEETDLFIGPETVSRLTMLAEKADKTGTPILNAFVFNDELYQSNPSVVQTNIPRAAMYAGAISRFLEKYPDATPVILARVDGEADKMSFTNQLKDSLEARGRNYKDLVFKGVLTVEDMGALSPQGSYVFIPVSAARSEFGKFISGLRDFKVLATENDGSISVFGFPEWTTFRGEQYDQLKEFDATIYSRFVNSDDYSMTRLRNAYSRWYGADWTDVEPNQALLGYDVALYAISNLRNGNGNFFPSALAPFKGVQSSFFLERPAPNSGYVNDAMYFINYRNAGSPFIEVFSVPVTENTAQEQ